jgi:pimeloyl-ACP methyl ester carboxylesterase
MQSCVVRSPRNCFAFIRRIMKLPLKTYQRQFALQRMAFGFNLLSPEVAEALRRGCLACAENQNNETGVIDFLCGLYLHFQNDLATHFTGDFAIVHGAKDDAVPLSQARELQAASPSADIWVVEGAEHGGAYATDPPVYVEKVAAFFERSLK